MKTIKYLLRIAAVLLALASAPGAGAQDSGFRETFDDPELPGWERAPQANVVEGVLEIAPGGYAFHAGAWSALELSIQVRLEPGSEAVVLYSDSDNGSFAVRIGMDHIALVRREPAGTSELAAAPNPAAELEWFRLNITAAPASHTVSVNGQELLTVSNPSPLPAGGIGLRNDGEGKVLFDDLELMAAASVPTMISPPGGPSGEFKWVRTGGPPGGIGYDIRYNFDDHDLWYVTDAYSGVHISTDRGITWVPSNSGIPAQAGRTGDIVPVFSLTVDPNDPRIVWVGTQNTGHIYKSTDAGMNWTQMDQGVVIQYDALSFRGFTIYPGNSDIVYAMAETTRNFPNPDETGGEIYKTTDGGSTWERIWDGGMPSALTRYMWINPDDHDIVYVSTGIFDRGAIGGTPDENLEAGLGILKSTDGGESWRVLGKENGLELRHIGSLYMHPEHPDILLAAAGHLFTGVDATQVEQQGYSPAGIYRTTDGGENWERVLDVPLTRLTEALSAVEFCPSDPDIVYAGSDLAVYRSEDGGENWKLVSGGDKGWGPPGVFAAWPIDLQCDPDDPERVFSNNYAGGNFLSEDGGVTWQNASQGYTGAQISFVTVDPDSPATIYAAGRSGIWVSYQGGSGWSGLRPNIPQIHPNDQGDIAVDPSDSKHIIAGGRPGFVLIQSFDGGATWEYLWSASEQGLPDTEYMLPSAIAIAPSDPSIVYAAGAHEGAPRVHEAYTFGVGVLVSKDGGAHWTRTDDSRLQTLGVYHIAVDPDREQVAYLATSEGIYMTQDTGDSWTLLDMGMDSTWVWVVAIDPQDSQRLIAGMEGVGAHISPDGGETWTAAVAGWEANGSPSQIVFDPTDPLKVYMSDALAGVYRSGDGGQSWSKINDGLNVRAVADLAISSDGAYLYAATEGDGVYRLDLAGQPPQGAASLGTGAEPAGPSITVWVIAGAVLLVLAGLGWYLNSRRGGGDSD